MNPFYLRKQEHFSDSVPLNTKIQEKHFKSICGWLTQLSLMGGNGWFEVLFLKILCTKGVFKFTKPHPNNHFFANIWLSGHLNWVITKKHLLDIFYRILWTISLIYSCNIVRWEFYSFSVSSNRHEPKRKHSPPSRERLLWACDKYMLFRYWFKKYVTQNGNWAAEREFRVN